MSRDDAQRKKRTENWFLHPDSARVHTAFPSSIFFYRRQNGGGSLSASPSEIALYDFFPFPEISRQAM